MKKFSILFAILGAIFAFPQMIFALPSEDECVEFCQKFVPAGDEHFLREQAKLALAGTQNAPWKNEISDEIFLNFILPTTSVTETPENWRENLRKIAFLLTKNCKNVTEAAEMLNQKIWEIVGVRYSPERDRPDQAPSQSMKIGKASCSGLSILLIDACRAIGVPARFISCDWPHKPGNHSWVEIFDGGEWHYLGAGDGGNADSAWFDVDTAMCENAPREHRIYAIFPSAGTDFSNVAGTKIALPWDDEARFSAIDVTEKYVAKNRQKLPLSVSVIDSRERRISLAIRVRDAGTGKILADEIWTNDDRFDLNHHAQIPGVPAGTAVVVELAGTANGAGTAGTLVPVATSVPGLLLFRLEN